MPYPPDQSACPSPADGDAPHNSGGESPGATSKGSVCSAPPCAASLLGDVAFTTATGTDARSGITFQPGENIYGPFEAGFASQQKDILERLGCADGSHGYVDGGIDTHVAEQLVAHQCSIKLPREEGDTYVSLLDECGGHTKEYHFHERLACLYSKSGGHSTKVGDAQDSQGIYGMYENFETSELPLLDACGGHFGLVPGKTNNTYHYHVQEKAPFTIGCFGPDKNEAGEDTLVTLAKCRSLYTGCGDDDKTTLTITIEGVATTFEYDPWCPCFDAKGSNVGNDELAVFAAEGAVLTCTGTCSSFTPVNEGGGSGGKPGGMEGDKPPILMVAGVAVAACALGAISCVFLKKWSNTFGAGGSARAPQRMRDETELSNQA